MANTYTNLNYHIVFSTKNRQPLISDDVEADLHAYIGGIIRAEGGILIEVNGMPDHVHLLVKLKPTMAISDFLRVVKANSAKWFNDKKSPQRRFGWQDGYAAFTVSKSQLPAVETYVRNQKDHHKKSDYQEELLALLKKHNVEFDKRYVLD